MAKPNYEKQKKPFRIAYWNESGVIVLSKFYIGKGKNRIQMDAKQFKLMVELLKKSIPEMQKKGIL